MNRFRLSIVSATALVLAACSTATPYRPLEDGYGYSERKVESNRYSVTFAGNSRTKRPVVEDYLLYRAAEVTLSSGYDYFVLAKQDTEADTRFHNTFVDYGGFGYYRFGPRFGTGVGVGVGTTSSTTEYEGQADIVMYKGKKLPKDVRAFDAREVKANIEPRVTRPEKT
ncbi:MAG: CC0125/CC1285 family lipoprotein [Nevskiales bacterium]